MAKEIVRTSNSFFRKKILMIPSNLRRENFIGAVLLYNLESSQAGRPVVRNIELFRKTVSDMAMRNVVVATAESGLVGKRHDQLCNHERALGELINNGASVIECSKGRYKDVLEKAVKSHETNIEYILVIGGTGAGKTSVSTLI